MSIPFRFFSLPCLVMEEQGSTTAYHSEGYELEGEGSLDHVEENETTVLFARLGDELQMLVQRYNVPPTDLEDLFQVHMYVCMYVSVFIIGCVVVTRAGSEGDERAYRGREGVIKRERGRDEKGL